MSLDSFDIRSRHRQGLFGGRPYSDGAGSYSGRNFISYYPRRSLPSSDLKLAIVERAAPRFNICVMMEKMFHRNQNILPRKDVGQMSSNNVTKVEQVRRVFRVFNLC